MRLSQLVFVPAVVWLAAGLATGQDAAQTPPQRR
jgi:hypothetical protein